VPAAQLPAQLTVCPLQWSVMEPQKFAGQTSGWQQVPEAEPVTMAPVPS
jgi:hypothetical protein